MNRKNYERVKIGDPFLRRNGAYIYRIYDNDQFNRGIKSFTTGFPDYILSFSCEDKS
jgi:hypothetical protein